MSVNEKMTAIADAIRDKTGGTEKLGLDAMASGVGEVYEKGKQAEYEHFWDNVPKGLDRYSFAGASWNVHTFCPNKRLTPRSGHPQYCFAWHNKHGEPYDMVEHLAKYGGSLDLSAAQNGDFLFYQANISRLPALNMAKFAKYNNTFQGCGNLVTIDSLTISPTAVFTNTFTGCTSLENIKIEGEIGNSVNFQDCPLSVESMLSIIFHLKEIHEFESDEAYAYSLYFSEDCWERLQAADPPEGNSDLEWKSYIENRFKWNT